MHALLEQYAKEENKAFNGFSQEAELVMQSYDWPGNVRQLQNVLRNIVVLNSGEKVTQEMLPPPLNELNPVAEVAKPAMPRIIPAADTGIETGAMIQPLWMVEREVIERAIEHCQGNIPKAAAALEVSASTIYRKRERWANGKS